MSLLQSDLSHLAPSDSISEPRRQATLPPRAAVVRQQLVAGILGYCLIAGPSCAFDARPNPLAPHNGAKSGAMRMPPSAAATELDAAADAMPTEASTKRPNASDAGAREMQQTGASDAALPTPSRARAMDAALPAQHSSTDAAIPDASRDAQSEPSKPDTAKHDAASTGSPAAEHCKPGAYTGTFSGSIQLVGLSLSSVTGTVRAELMPDATGDYLELHNGRVMGVDQDGNRLTCDLSGSVNCATDELEDGKLENGNLHNQSSDSDTAFIGSAEAMYSHDPFSLVGTFSVEAKDSSLLGGRGTWSLLRGN